MGLERIDGGVSGRRSIYTWVWQQIALVHDGVTLYAYLNGSLAGSTSSGVTALPSPASDGKVYLAGAGRTGANLYFGGELDEVQFSRLPYLREVIQA